MSNAPNRNTKLVADAMLSPERHSLTPLRYLLRFALPYRRQLLLVALLTIGNTLAMLAVPWLAGQLLGGIVAQDLGGMKWLMALLLVVLLTVALLNYFTTWIVTGASAQLLARLRVNIYEHLQGLPIGFHENHRQGDILALMTYEVARLSQFLTGTLTSIPSRLLTVAGAVILMIRMDIRLGLIVPMLIPLFFLIIKVLGRRLRGLARALQEAEADVVAAAEEDLQMLPAIKAFTRETAEAQRYGARVDTAMALTIQEGRITAALEPALGFLAAASAVLLLWLGGRSLAAGAMTPTELFRFLFYAALLARPVGALADVYGQVQTARGTLGRLQTVLREKPEPGYAATGKLEQAKGEIRFEKIAFAYPGRDRTLDGVDLHIHAGEVVAFVGRNGAGKSTLINLLLRYYEPVEGQICLDNNDIQEIDVRDLRRQIGLVSQRVLLFNGTLRANIAYGREDATDAEIAAAARLAQAYDFIVGLPRGFDTEIGDNGIRLSGGQRQRVALARALIKNPTILILDEATAMLDLEGESAFVEVCLKALKGRTVLLVTHRPASLALADRILCVENGIVQVLQEEPTSKAENGATRFRPAPPIDH